MFKIIGSSIAILLLTVACEQKSINNQEVKLVPLAQEENTPAQSSTNEASYNGPALDFVKGIELTPLEKFEVKQSLRFEVNDEGLVEQVDAYYLDGVLVKAVEKYQDGFDGLKGTKVFYFGTNQKLMAVFHNYDDYTKDVSMFVEKRTYYENGTPVITQFRSTDNYEELPNLGFSKIRTEDNDTTRVMELVEGRGRFNPHFIGLLEAENELYILLGEPNVNVGFFSAVKVTEPDAFIQDLLKKEAEYLNKPVNIDFYVTSGNIRAQIYKSGAWN